MSVPNSQEEQASVVPQTNAFGEEIPVATPVAEPVVETPAAKDGAADDESKVTPTERITKMSEELGTLKTKLEHSDTLHKKKDDDIRAMADKIKRFEQANGGNQKGGETQEGDVLFKEIKTSKDLTEDEKDEMSEGEIKMFDELASMKKTMNAMHQAALAAQAKGATPALDVNATVKTAALALADNDADNANKIIEAFNGAKFNTADMTAEEIQANVDLVAGKILGFKKPAETTVRPAPGKPANAGNKTDPYGVDSIVAQATKKATSHEVYKL